MGIKYVCCQWCELFFTGFFFLAGVGSSAGQQPTENSASEQCSIFRVALAYAEAIHTCDVLVLERQSYDKLKLASSPTEGTHAKVILSRTVFDQSRDRVLVAASEKSEWLEFDKMDQRNQGRSVKVAKSGFLFDYQKRQTFYKRGSKLLEIPWIRKENANFDDPRAAGMSGTRFGPFDWAQKAFSGMATGDTLIDSKETEKSLELRINWSRLEESKANYVRHFFFDKKTHLPKRCLTYVEFDAGGRTEPEDAYFEWKEISNIYVPVKIRAKGLRGYKGPRGEDWDGDLSTEFTLEWLMINEPLPESRFDPSNLTDSQKFIESIDPVINNAKSIIKILEEEKAEAESESEKPRDDR